MHISSTWTFVLNELLPEGPPVPLGGVPRQGEEEGKPPPGIRRFGRKEEKKKGKRTVKKIRRKRRYVERRGALHARPGGSANYIKDIRIIKIQNNIKYHSTTKYEI